MVGRRKLGNLKFRLFFKYYFFLDILLLKLRLRRRNNLVICFRSWYMVFLVVGVKVIFLLINCSFGNVFDNLNFKWYKCLKESGLYVRWGVKVVDKFEFVLRRE